jgi:hypothetical protein
MLILGLL